MQGLPPPTQCTRAIHYCAVLYRVTFNVHLLSRNIAVVKMITGGIRIQSVSTITRAVAIFCIQFVFKPERLYSRNYVYSLISAAGVRSAE